MIQEYLLTFPQEVAGIDLQSPNPESTALSQRTVANNIAPAETRYLLPLLGKELLDDMIANRNSVPSSYPSGGPNVEKFPSNAAYEDLWKRFLLNYISQGVLLETLPFIQYQISQQGIVAKDTEYSKHSGKEGLGRITDQLNTRIGILEEQIKKHICENRDDFPLYPVDELCDDCGCKDCGYTGYIYLLNKKVRCSCQGKGDRSNIIFY